MSQRETGRPLKVCHLVATTLGATWMFEQLRELRDRHGHEVTAIVNGSEGPLVDLLRSQNIPFHVCDFGLAGNLRGWAILRAVFRLVRLFRAERYEVVQTHIFVSLLAARPAAWIAGVPVRLAMIAGPFHLEAKASRLVERLTQWMDTALIPSCEKSRRLCEELGVAPARLRLIAYSVDLARFTVENAPASGIRREFGWPEATPVIVLVAYFYPRLGEGPWVPKSLHGRALKGHEDLIHAVPLVLDEFPDARFVLVGGSFAGMTDYFEEIKTLIARLGLQNRIMLTGHRTDVSGILREASVAVQASLCENLGGTLEALAMERPMVATRVGGMVDAIEEGVTGLLANPRDHVDLARRIRDLLRDPHRARELGLRGRERIMQRFTISRTVDDLDALYRDQMALAEERGDSDSLIRSVGRAAFAIPWLSMVFARARVTGEKPRDLARRFAAKLIGAMRRRLYVFRTRAARAAYPAWVALAPKPLAQWVRRQRTRLARQRPRA